MEIFGDDYDTPDGTCIRDYIHVSDLADIHVAALQHLETGGQSGVFNCGYGRGYSVREVLSRVEQVAGVKLDLRVGPRRPGDSPALVADPCRLREAFAWRPAHADLSAIVETQIKWERSLSEAPAAADNGT